MKHLLQHFKTLTKHPKNAEELKGLILQLAIQGKITENWRRDNPNTESSSVLLKNIEVEKERLIAEKKIKKEKALPLINEEDLPYSLPKNWTWCYLNDLGVIGSSSRVHKKDWQNEGVPFYRAREIVKLSKYGEVDNDLFITEDLFSKHKENGLVPEENDIMLTGVGTIGVPYIVRKDDKFYFKDASVLIFKNIFRLNQEFLELFFHSPFWIKEIHKNSMGTTVHTLTISRGKVILVPFPPLEEQKAIVAIVNELFAEVEQLEDQTKTSIQLKEDFVTSALQRLSQTENVDQEWQFLQNHFTEFFTEKENVKQLRETILQLAVQGKLTTKWRSQNPDIEPASELFKRHKKRRLELITEKKIKKDKALLPIEDDESLNRLPINWIWCRMGEVGNIMTSAFVDGPFGSSINTKRDYIESGVPVLRMVNVKPFHFKEDSMKYISEEKFKRFSRHNVMPGDILFSKVGAGIGESCIVPKSFNYGMLSTTGISRIRVGEIVLNEYLCHFINGHASYFKGLSQNSAQPFLNMTHIRSTPFPFPPLEEQKTIVEKVNSLMALCDSLEEHIEHSQTQIEQLMQSCLREVFEDRKEVAYE